MRSHDVAVKSRQVDSSIDPPSPCRVTGVVQPMNELEEEAPVVCSEILDTQAALLL